MKTLRFATVIATVAAFSVVFQASTIAAECTPKSFRTAAEQCASQFFDVITTDTEQECSLSYQTMKNCIKGEKENCWKRCSSEWTLQEISNQAWGYIQNEDFFCKKGMLKSFDPAAIKGCTGTFYRKAGEVSRRFHDAFQEQRNSSKLCGLFSGAKKRIKKYLQDYCTPTIEVTQISSQYNDTYNPYCTKGKTFLEQIFGRCTRRSWEKLVRKCTAKFMEILKENGGEDCASAFRSYQTCKGATLTYCHEGFYDTKEELSQSVNDSLAQSTDLDKHRLCDGTNMEAPHTRPDQCKKEYKQEVRRCGAKMSQTYRTDRTDPSLCREYTKAKICAKSIIKSMCNMTEDMKAYVEFYYDDFNPFSSTSLDPELTPTTGETTESATMSTTTSQAKTEHPPVHLVLGLIVLLWVF